jgi:hypothetical protein
MTQRDMKASADKTAPEQRGVPFKPGQSGNPSGRPRGARSKLSEGFLSALQADFEQNGVEVIAKVRKDKPDVYLKVVANLMPARLEAQLEAQVTVDIFSHEGSSIDEILELVAVECGPENAVKLAEVFRIEPPRRRQSYHPAACYDANGQPTFCTCEVGS